MISYIAKRCNRFEFGFGMHNMKLQSYHAAWPNRNIAQANITVFSEMSVQGMSTYGSTETLDMFCLHYKMKECIICNP